MGYNSWDCEEWDTTELLHIHFSLSCIGEGNDNPLQYSCLENPRDGGAWWATVHGVEKSRTRLSDFTYIRVTVNGLQYCPEPLTIQLREVFVKWRLGEVKIPAGV